MRLLERQNNGDFRLTNDLRDNAIPRYAMLSHTWGLENEEVTFAEMMQGSGRSKAGYKKIKFCGERAARDGLKYFWVDSCCIDKSSSAELQEAIVSMFRWYQRAAKCYVYLSDVSTRKRKRRDDNSQNTWEQAFRESRWFGRGWTLQELLAPTSVEFFSSEGIRLGDQKSLERQIHEVTGIAVEALRGAALSQFDIDERLSWAKTRRTTRAEDEAYCLIGIFDISMAIRYGEGRSKAFQRLENKIRKTNITAANTQPPAGNEHISKDMFDAILKCLSSPHPVVNYEKALKQRQAKTGLWFIQHKRYTEWKSGKSQFLWLHGIPGCGKSILTSTVIEDLLQLTSQATGSAVAYFYFDFNDPQKRRTDLMVRSILAQLLQSHAENSVAVAALFSSCNGGKRTPSLDACVDVFRQMINEIPRVFVVLDALDECESRKELLEILSSMSEWRAHNLHILLTSRKVRDIEDSLVQIIDNEYMICLRSELVDPDIRAYIRERLSRDKSLEKWQKGNEIEEIERILMEKADGMFRWAACQLDALAKCRNRAQLRKSLSTLPPTLDETYERILCAITEEDAEYAVRILRWLTFSARPLLFEEVAKIVALDPEREVPFDESEVLQDPLDVLEICSSLVTTTTALKEEFPFDLQNRTGQAVVLAHYSVQEYLTSQRCLNGRASQYAVDEAACHTLISESCLTFLFYHWDEYNEDISNLGLCNYSAKFWIYHAGKGQKHAPWTQRAVMLLSDPNAILQWIRIYDPDRPRARSNRTRTQATIPQGLYYASLAGFVEVARELLGKGADVNAQGGEYGNALQVASLRGHEQVVKLLLDKGADVNAQGTRLYGNALRAASLKGHEQVVKLLLDKGADVNAQGGHYGNALLAASLEGRERVVKLLLDEGANVNAQGGYYSNALQTASLKGHKQVVKLLLDKGANVNAQGGYYGNALQAALLKGHEQVVKLLLDEGANVNAQGGECGNALQAASLQSHEQMVKLLLDKGANVNAQGGRFSNALLAASLQGHEQVVKLLLDKGADVNAQGGHYGNALQAASRRGHEQVVKLLLDKGASVNTQGGHYGNALEVASLKGHEQVVKLLLDRGANVNTQGGHYGNALQAASLKGHEEVVKLLIDKGANVNAQGGECSSALQAASLQGHEQVVKLLIDKGADVNALRAASLQGHEQVVKLLLDKGADVNVQGEYYATRSERLHLEATSR